MYKKSLLSGITLLCLALSTPSHAGPSSDQKVRRVGKIEIIVHEQDGSTQENPKPLEIMLQTKQGDVFVQRDFDKDLKALSEKYENVDSKVYAEGQEVVIELDLYPKSTLREISFEGNESFKDKKLREILNIKAGETFDTAKFNQQFAELKKHYMKEGFFEAELDYELLPDTESNDMDLLIKIKEGSSGKVGTVKFEGLTKTEIEAIEPLLATKTYSFFTSWLSGKGTYDEAALERDRLVLLNFLHDKGYADAIVTAKVLPADKENRLEVLFTAEKGNPYTISNITFEGNSLFTNEQIVNLLKVKKGEKYSPELLQATVRNISDAYGNKGYIDARISYDLSLVPDQDAYNVNFRISEGAAYRVGMIKIFGNTNTHNSVILHETLLVPGDVFQTGRLQKTEERLMNVGYFKSVNVYAAQPEEDHPLGENYRDVYIEVEETGTGNLSLFFGYSTLDSLFGGAEISEYNFDYKGIAKLFSEGPSALRGGGEYFRLKFSLGRKFSTLNLGWSKPFFMDTPWEVGFNIERSISELQSNDYEIRSLGLSLHASYPLSLFWRFGWNYTIKKSDVSIEESVPEQLKRQAELEGVVSSTGISFSYDSTNRPYMPTQGFRSTIGGTLAGLGGKVNFLQLNYINTYYATPFKKLGTFKTRLDMQFIKPVLGTTADTLPFDNRLYLGGETSVRGYRGLSIGPQFTNGDPKGGISSFLLSQEYMQKIYKSLSGFVFVDAGSISDRSYHISKLAASYGVGLHVEVMPGVPIVVGIGFPINPPSKSHIQRPFISIGGRF